MGDRHFLYSRSVIRKLCASFLLLQPVHETKTGIGVGHLGWRHQKRLYRPYSFSSYWIFKAFIGLDWLHSFFRTVAPVSSSALLFKNVFERRTDLGHSDFFSNAETHNENINFPVVIIIGFSLILDEEKVAWMNETYHHPSISSLSAVIRKRVSGDNFKIM